MDEGEGAVGGGGVFETGAVDGGCGVVVGVEVGFGGVFGLVGCILVC